MQYVQYVKVCIVILPCSVLRWEGHERSGYSSLESHCTGNLPDYKFIWSLFRFLQLLCEGHNEGRTLYYAIYLLYVLHVSVHPISSCVYLVVGEYLVYYWYMQCIAATQTLLLVHRRCSWCSHCVTGTQTVFLVQPLCYWYTDGVSGAATVLLVHRRCFWCSHCVTVTS